MARKKSTTKKTKKYGCRPGQAMTTKKTCRSIAKARISTMRTAYIRNKTDKARLIALGKKQGYVPSKQGAAPKDIQKLGMSHRVSFRKKK